MDRSDELREFLRSRRSRLEPADVGLDWQAVGRRTAGLRREELALVAGISVDYYARLEQGRARNVSDQVVDALATALRLDDIEREHLRRLTRTDAKSSPRSQAQVVSARTRSMIEALRPTPALVHNSMLDVLAVNTMAGVLLEGLLDMPPSRRNLARWLFLRPESHRTFLDREESARELASSLRTAATRSGDTAVHALIDELTVGSAEFVSYWTEHQLSGPGAFTKRVHHDAVGEFELSYQSLVIPQEADQYVALYTPQPGSPSAERLALLAARTADSASRPAQPSTGPA
ncbi:Xre family transcriptional regulator [Haloactinopolyspora alba]|uniref:Xre family transcriptional regulator n=1 Tax=Haloactinopolyspora alba TaxID=648780 RepID=A0A2P8E119_9ACTN|nr:helix-turn-helix transcriptional regulator [Haloactinopolyspora alba]PSL03107.1 Xre family transcriptional regulator [Haloactinopolyspora alba]